MTCSPRRHRWPIRAELASVMVAAAVLTLALPASAVPGSQGCPIATLPGFSQAAVVNLGCATSEPFTTDVAEQAFEHGQMLWVAEWGTISVLWADADGRYDAYDDLFDPEKPEPAALAATD